MKTKLNEALDANINGSVNGDGVEKFFLDQCKDLLINKTVTKKDIESFLSTLKYNVHRETLREKIPKKLYSNTIRYDLYDKAKRAAPPPPLQLDNIEKVNADILTDHQKQKNLKRILGEL